MFVFSGPLYLGSWVAAANCGLWRVQSAAVDTRHWEGPLWWYTVVWTLPGKGVRLDRRGLGQVRHEHQSQCQECGGSRPHSLQPPTTDWQQTHMPHNLHDTRECNYQSALNTRPIPASVIMIPLNWIQLSQKINAKVKASKSKDLVISYWF